MAQWSAVHGTMVSSAWPNGQQCIAQWSAVPGTMALLMTEDEWAAELQITETIQQKSQEPDKISLVRRTSRVPLQNLRGHKSLTCPQKSRVPLRSLTTDLNIRVIGRFWSY